MTISSFPFLYFPFPISCFLISRSSFYTDPAEKRVWFTRLLRISGLLRSPEVLTEVCKLTLEDQALFYSLRYLFNFSQQEWRQFVIDWNRPLPSESDDTGDAIEVPQTFCPLAAADQQELFHCISPSAPSNNYGIDLYLATLSFVQETVLYT